MESSTQAHLPGIVVSVRTGGVGANVGNDMLYYLL